MDLMRGSVGSERRHQITVVRTRNPSSVNSADIRVVIEVVTNLRVRHEIDIGGCLFTETVRRCGDVVEVEIRVRLFQANSSHKAHTTQIDRIHEVLCGNERKEPE